LRGGTAKRLSALLGRVVCASQVAECVQPIGDARVDVDAITAQRVVRTGPTSLEALPLARALGRLDRRQVDVLAGVHTAIKEQLRGRRAVQVARVGPGPVGKCVLHPGVRERRLAAS